jgi:hypothetical protein
MAFAWTAVAVDTIFTAAHYNQVKTNTDTLCGELGIANYTWTLFPVSAGSDRFDYNDTKQLRDAIDYVFDNNSCSSDNLTNWTTVDPIQCVVFDANVDDAVDNDQHNTYNADKDTTVDNDQHTTYNADKDTTVDNDQHNTYNSGTNSPVNSIQNTGVK